MRPTFNYDNVTNVISERPKITSLEAGRGIASLLVVLFHLPNYGKRIDLFPAVPLGGFFRFGHAGVDFFFVLSGFILTYAHFRDLGRPELLGIYGWKRFSRIFPLYWIVLAAVLAMVFYLPGYGQPFQREAGTVLRSIFLLRPEDGAELTVAWTLSHELVFYAVFGLAILSRTVGLAVFGGWMIASVIMLALGTITHDVILNAYNIEFLFGVTAAITVLKMRVPLPWLLFGGGAMGFVLTGVAEDYSYVLQSQSLQRIGYGLSAMMLTCGMVQLNTERKLNVPRSLSVLGNASYSLYLTHTWVLSIILQVLIVLHVPQHVPPLAMFVVLAAGAVVVALLCHRFIEQPIIHASRQVSRRLASAPTGDLRSAGAGIARALRRQPARQQL